MRQMTLTQSGAPGPLFAEPISHTSTQYIDFVEILNISLDLSFHLVCLPFILLILVSVVLPLSVVVTVS